MGDSQLYDLFSAGRAALDDGRPLDAISPLEAARDTAPDQGSIREALALAYLRTHRNREAEIELEVLVDLAPADAYAYYLLGRAQQRLGRITLARSSYKLATWLAPDSATYQVALDALPAA